MSTTASVTEQCPAFAAGCPFPAAASAGNEEEKELLAAVKACPAFAAGCPFKSEASSVSGVADKLREMPASHGADGELGGAVAGAMKAVHAAGHRIKEEDMQGAACPVFAMEGCPFKGAAMTSDGRPLVSALDLRLWLGEEEAALPLSKALKEGTKTAHQEAENVHFVKDFLRGGIDPELYVKMVVDLCFVYGALEDGLRRHADQEVIRELYFPEELNRAEALRQDVAFLKGTRFWTLYTSPSAAARDYVRHLEALRDGPAEGAGLLLAHAYTRYLGDLSGGRVLMRAARKLMRSRLGSSERGLSFYHFDKIPNPKAFKTEYRARLDSLPLSAAAADALVREANLAFVLNTRLFQELDVAAGVRDAVDDTEVLLRGLNLGEEAAAPAENGAAAACPFAGLAAAGVPVPASHAKFVRQEKPAKAEKKCPMPFRVLHDPLCVARDVDAMLWAVGLVAVVSSYVQYLRS